MKSATLTFAALGLLAFGAANAQVSGSVTLTGTSDYDFRGVSQSSADPVFQGSLDLESESGWYIGVWGSQVDFGPGDGTDSEFDWYAGFALGETWVWDAGIVRYSYPDLPEAEYTEVWAGVDYEGAEGWSIGGKQWYTWDFFGASNTDGYYTELNGSYDTPWWGIGLTAHVGYTWGDGPDDLFDTYTDYSIGFIKHWWDDRIETHIRWVDTDLSGNLSGPDDAFENDGRVIGHISVTFP